MTVSRSTYLRNVCIQMGVSQNWGTLVFLGIHGSYILVLIKDCMRIV